LPRRSPSYPRSKIRLFVFSSTWPDYHNCSKREALILFASNNVARCTARCFIARDCNFLFVPRYLQYAHTYRYLISFLFITYTYLFTAFSLIFYLWKQLIPNSASAGLRFPSISRLRSLDSIRPRINRDPTRSRGRIFHPP
jgi:hypothetical protein